MPIKLLVGLRNPGIQYEKTRHNAGAWFVDALSKQYDASFKVEKKFYSELANIEIGSHAVKIARPLVFMNQSGRCVRSICQFYQIKAHELLVVHDELDLLPGRVKLKSNGGHGGHNGLRDIASQLGSNAFHRLRIGIGHPGHKHLVTDYVLQKPPVDDVRLIVASIERAIDALPLIAGGDMAQAMCCLNGQ